MNYVVKMMDNEQIIVPEKVGLAILKADVDRVNWNNRMINLNSISRIEPEEKNEYKQLPLETPKPYSRQKYLRALKSMVDGCRKVKGHKAQALADRMEKKLKQVSNQKEEVYDNPVRDFYKVL